MRLSSFLLLSMMWIMVLVAIPSSTALACGSTKSGCKKEVKVEFDEKNCCSSASQKDHACGKHKNCGGDCGDNACHCTSSSTSAQVTFPDQPAIYYHPLIGYTAKKAAWYFLNTIPDAVYLSIFLPPKIGGSFYC